MRISPSVRACSWFIWVELRRISVDRVNGPPQTELYGNIQQERGRRIRRGKNIGRRGAGVYGSSKLPGVFVPTGRSCHSKNYVLSDTFSGELCDAESVQPSPLAVRTSAVDARSVVFMCVPLLLPYCCTIVKTCCIRGEGKRERG